MITKYFTKVTVRFDPFSAGAKAARNFLTRIPPSMKGQCVINHKVLTSASEQSIIEVTYKDKFVTQVDPTKLNFKEVAAHFDTHSRKLAIQDAISG